MRPSAASARRRTASFPVVAGVFGVVFAAMIAGATLDDRGPDQAERRRAALDAYEQAVQPAAREAGAAIVLGIRPDITDFRDGRISAAVFRDDMRARASQFDKAARTFAAAPRPGELDEAVELFDRAFLHFRLAVVALHEAGGVEGGDREALLRLGAELGNVGDSLYDQAGAVVQAGRRRAGLPSSALWGDATGEAHDTGPATAGGTVEPAVEVGCVLPGGEQRLRVAGAQAGGAVSFDTEYADGSSGLVGGYTSGTGRGTAGADGRFALGWRVPADAPPGPAQVHVGTVASSGRVVVVTATFTVGSPERSCP